VLKENHKTFALLLVPLMLAVLDFFFLKAAFPLHSGSPGYDQDPAYAYLFNGLLILEGYPPYHIDHPGTPLQLLFALTIFIRWLITRLLTGSSLDFVDSVMSDPESYLFDMAVLLLALNLYALTFFGRRISEATGKIYLGMFCQLSLLCFTIMAPKATYPAPEAVLIFCSLILLGLLSPRIFRPTNTNESLPSVSSKLVGATFALGLAVKITFAPMVLLFALLPKGKERRIGLVVALLVFLLLTTPALPNIDRFLAWVTGLISNSGIHGGGGAGFINLKDTPKNLLNLLVWFPLFTITTSITLILVLKKVLLAPPVLIRSPSILLLVVFVQICLVLKHPGAHYMVSVLPVSFILITWLALMTKLNHPIKKSLLTIGVGLLVLHSILITTVGVKKQIAQRAAMSEAMIDIEKILADYHNPIIVCSYRCALPKYALTMALIYAPQLISERTLKYLTNFYDFDIFQSKLIAAGAPPKIWTDLDPLVTSGRVIIVVSPTIYPQLVGIPLIPLTSFDVQNAYIYHRKGELNN
jgi:hypothetical protein